MALYGQDLFLRGDPSQVVTFLGGASWEGLENLVTQTRDRRDADLPVIRSDMAEWLRECTRTRGSGHPRPDRPTLPGLPDDTRPGNDAHIPPQVGARDHTTLDARLQYQSRNLHLPYVRSASYDQKVTANIWTRADLRAHDDPYSLTSGSGLTLNQDGYWTFLIKTDWSIGHPELVVGAAQATRLMVNGSDVGLRDYLDDDAYSVKAPINTFTWSDEFRAGTRINIDVRTEGLGANYTAVCNVYLRAVLMRCTEGEFDMVAFPLSPPRDPNPPTVPNPPMCGTPPAEPSDPCEPQWPNECGDEIYGQHFFTNDAGQVGCNKCVGGQMTTQWSSMEWGGGANFGGASPGGARDIFPGAW